MFDKILFIQMPLILMLRIFITEITIPRQVIIQETI